jgi:hypothetical protein
MDKAKIDAERGRASQAGNVVCDVIRVCLQRAAAHLQGRHHHHLSRASRSMPRNAPHRRLRLELRLCFCSVAGIPVFIHSRPLVYKLGAWVTKSSVPINIIITITPRIQSALTSSRPSRPPCPAKRRPHTIGLSRQAHTPCIYRHRIRHAAPPLPYPPYALLSMSDHAPQRRLRLPLRSLATRLPDPGWVDQGNIIGRWPSIPFKMATCTRRRGSRPIFASVDPAWWHTRERLS